MDPKASERGRSGIRLFDIGGIQIRIDYSWFFAGALLGGLWLIFIGMFLRGAAAASFQELASRQILKDMRVDDLELEDIVTVPPDMHLHELIDDYFLRYGYDGFPVSRNGDTVGMVTLSAVKNIPQSERDVGTVGDAMEPLKDEQVIRPDTSLDEVFTRFRKGAQRLLVMTEGGELTGIITPRELLRLLEVHEALAR